MQVLFVSRCNSKGEPHAFVSEQAQAIRDIGDGVTVEHFMIKRGGLGYLAALLPLVRILLKTPYHVVHAHYGLSGVTAVLACKLLFFRPIKKVVTYHGSDLNVPKERRVSLLVARLADVNILVSSKMKAFDIPNGNIIPCGIDMGVNNRNRQELRRDLGWSSKDVVVLFASSFDRQVKDPEFAFKVIEQLRMKMAPNAVKFIELKGYTRSQLNDLMLAADMLLMCSKTEGSPQVIKEALMNDLPIVSNDVGEVSEICSHSSNALIVEKKVDKYVDAILSILEGYTRAQTDSAWLSRYDNKKIAEQIMQLYLN